MVGVHLASVTEIFTKGLTARVPNLSWYEMISDNEIVSFAILTASGSAQFFSSNPFKRGASAWTIVGQDGWT